MLENELMVVTFNTIDMLFKEENGADAVSLYMFYYKQVKRQQRQFDSDVPDQEYLCKSTDDFCMEGLGFGKTRFYKAKALLKKSNLIKKVQIREKGDYKTHLIQVKYIGFCTSHQKQTLLNAPSAVSPTNTQETININTQETKKEILLSRKNDFSKLQHKLDEFKKMRKLIKKPMTEVAVSRLLAKLDRLASTEEEKIAILDQSIFFCRQDVYELKQPLSDPIRDDLIKMVFSKHEIFPDREGIKKFIEKHGEDKYDEYKVKHDAVVYNY